jgi:alkylation response protein AidB-like acyl-CoA dehydrogenase
VDTLLVMNALGAALVVEPYLGAAVLTPTLIARLGDEAASAALLPDIAAGERIVIVAHQEPGTRGELNHVATEAKRTGNGYVLNGRKSVIVHGATADELLITARTSGGTGDSDGISVFRVEPGTAAVTLKSYRTFDGQSAADIELDGVELPASSRVGAEGKAFAALEAAHDVALSALCAEAVGIMQTVNATTLEYTKSRKQFGQPIAKFQVLQHRMADMFLQAEQALSMSYLAAIKCVDPDPAERRRALSAAKVVIGQAGRFIGQQAIQLHGGMGMTDELMVSHHFKRLTGIDLSNGDTDFHLQRFIAVAN